MADTTSSFWKFYKVARWFVLAALIIMVLLMMKDPGGRPAALTPAEAKENAESFSNKLTTLETARSHHESAEVHFTADEINASVASPENQQAMAAAVNAHASPAAQPAGNAEADAAKNVKSTQVSFEGDHATVYVVVPYLGRDLHLQVSCKLGVQGGYVTLDPLGAKIGDLSVPASALNEVLQRKLQEPEMREKLHLPEFVSGLRVENGELVISEAP